MDIIVEKPKTKGKEYLKNWIPYSIKRYWTYLAVTIVGLVLPWITINGNHLFLLNFDQKKLHFAGIAFDMQELYLMPFLLMLLFLGIFALTAVGGRAWCGWFCPQTIFRVIYRDLIETKILGMRKRITNKQKDPDMSLASNQIKRVVAILIWSSLALLAAANFMWYFVPPEDFFAYLANPAEHMVLIGFLLGIALFLVVDVIFIKENFCVYICPYSRVQSVLYDKDTVMAIYDPHRGGEIYNGHGNDRIKQFSKQKDLLVVEPNAECTTCESCVTVCPTHIDIRKGLQLECINCLECVDACTKVMGALGKPSLVKWSSEKETIAQDGKTEYFRSKTIMYFAALSLVFIALLVMGSKKETMLINIDKTTRPYKIVEDSKTVENDYLILVTNTDAKAHDMSLEIVGNKNITITRPTEPFHMSAGAKKKTVVVLSTKEILNKDADKDLSIPVHIKAFAVDDKAKIHTTQETVFMYPSKNQLKK